MQIEKKVIINCDIVMSIKDVSVNFTIHKDVNTIDEVFDSIKSNIKAYNICTYEVGNDITFLSKCVDGFWSEFITLPVIEEVKEIVDKMKVEKGSLNDDEEIAQEVFEAYRKYAK